MRCNTTDLDHMVHMNNSRYSRECDFGRFDLMINNGFLNVMKKNKFNLGLSATTIRFRRSINFLESATLKSKVRNSDTFALFSSQICNTDNVIYELDYVHFVCFLPKIRGC